MPDEEFTNAPPAERDVNSAELAEGETLIDPAPLDVSNDGSDRKAAHIAALQFERDGYVNRGLKDRAAEVDASLAAYGVEKPRGGKSAPATEKAVQAAPKAASKPRGK